MDVPHQAIVEFVSVLYPAEAVLRTAIRGCATYQLRWCGAHPWADAEHDGLEKIWSEDCQAGRYDGSVKTVNPFAGVE